MNKQVILGIAIASAFVIGVLSANPVVEAVGGWQAAVADLLAQITSNDSDIADLEARISELEEIGFMLPLTISSQLGVFVGQFWGIDTFESPGTPSSDILSVTPAIVPSGTITGFELEVIGTDTLSVDVRLYLNGVSTSLVCTVPAGQLSCSATGSVVVTGISEVVMKNEGPVGVPGNTGVLRDPTAILAIQ